MLHVFPNISQLSVFDVVHTVCMACVVAVMRPNRTSMTNFISVDAHRVTTVQQRVTKLKCCGAANSHLCRTRSERDGLVLLVPNRHVSPILKLYIGFFGGGVGLCYTNEHLIDALFRWEG